MAEINADINELRKICLNRPNASHFLGHPLIILGSLYESNHNFKNSAKAYEEAYFVSKEKDYMALLCLKKASEAYKKCSNDQSGAFRQLQSIMKIMQHCLKNYGIFINFVLFLKYIHLKK